MQGASCSDLPCLNGGVCVDDGGELSCDCSAVAFDGPLCEQPPTVTFTVDMACAGLQSFDAVYVFGTFNGWCSDCLPLERVGESDLWRRSVTYLEPQEIEYKYQVDKAAQEEELGDDMWAGGTCAPITDLSNKCSCTDGSYCFIHSINCL